MLRLSDTQSAKNRDLTVEVYQNKMGELEMKLAETQYLEEQYRSVQQSLQERERAFDKLQQEYISLRG